MYSDFKMPVLFLGHGSPMNALADNVYTSNLKRLGKKIPKPLAILCISAHWMTRGTWITHLENPKTIHDFSGFPESLFKIQYPASGNPELAELIQKIITTPKIELDHDWGLDHGSWSVLRHMYPKADIPVLQLSLNMEEPPEYHFNLGMKLQKLRDLGILIVSSGNIVHNLRRISWDEKAGPPSWALEFDQWVKDKILARDFKALQNDFLCTEAGGLSVPTTEHYLPLLYAIGASQLSDSINFEYEGMQNSSISMRCISFGLPEEIL